MMDKELLRRLMSGEKVKKVPTKKFAILRDGEKVALGSMPVGAYEGKQGTYRRSRKGASRIQPNGSRYYVAGSDDILAYKC
jgi:hypothetical protein